MSEVYSTKNLDHLGIVAGVCQHIDLIGQIDARVADSGRKVSVGQAVQAMVLNGLGFVGRALYLTPEFYRSKPVDLLVGEGIEADDLNSDSLSKALDYLYETGVTELFAAVSAHALRSYGIVVEFAHADTTAFSLHGEYEFDEDPLADDGEGQPITVTYGHSKDHRPDLKQAILSLICANQSSIPVYLEALSGNTADKSSLPQTAQAYLEQFGDDEALPVLVVDSALYAADTLQDLASVKWVTRVPATLTEVKTLLADSDRAQMSASEQEGYFYHEVTSSYGDVPQRWLLVLYEPRRQAEQQRLDKQIARERDQLDKQLRKLQRQSFNCEQDARQALRQFGQQWSFHGVSGSIERRERYANSGRPTADSPTVTEWYLQPTVAQDDEAIAHKQQRLGKYVLATNELDATQLPPEALLALYKAQNTSVERGFRFLKDPLFFAHSLFLKKPSRIMALLMVMGLCLLIYALAEHHLRQQLLQQDQTIPDQKGKPTQRPTMRRVFQMFEGIHVLTIMIGDLRKRMVTNVKPVHVQMATLLGDAVLKFYVFEEYPL
jgi:transposase